MKNLKRLTIWVVAVLTFCSSTLTWAEGEEGQGEATPKSSYMTWRQELWELKETDPEAFKAKVTELRNNAQKRLDQLKQTDPEAYQRVLERRQKRIEPRFERMRQEDPEAYQRMREHRQGLIEKRMNWLRTNEPEKYAELEQRREHFRSLTPEQRAERIERGHGRPRFEKQGHGPRRGGPNRQRDGR